MANRKFDKPYVVGERLVRIAGSFVALAGAGTVTASTVRGFGFGYSPVNGAMALQTSARPGITSTPGILRSNTGLYTVTLDDSYLESVTAHAWLIQPTGGSTNLCQVIGDPTNIGVSGLAPTYTIRTADNTNAAADLGTTFRIAFMLVLRDSTERYGKP